MLKFAHSAADNYIERNEMRRIIVLTLIIAFISTLALAESQQAPSLKPKGYSIDISNYKVVVVTPLDKGRSVLVSFFDKSGRKPKEISAYLAQGMLALTISQLTRLVARRPDESKLVSSYLKEMVKARKNALDIDSKKLTVAN